MTSTGYAPNNTVVVIGYGPPADSAFITPPADGQQYVDELTALTYVRVKGVWQGQVQAAGAVQITGASGALPYIVAPSGGNDTLPILGAIATGKPVLLAIGSFNLTVDQAVLSTVGQQLNGCGRQMTTLNITGAGTWGVKLTAADCEVNHLTISGTVNVTYGVGVSTASSAEGTQYHDVESVGCVNSFAVSPDGHADVANTMFFGCKAQNYTNAGWIIGDGVAGNVLNTHMFGCTFSGKPGNYGVLAQGTGFTWHGGDGSNNSVSDFFGSAAANPTLVQGYRGDGTSGRLWATGGPSQATCFVTFEDVVWPCNSMNADGKWILHQLGGSITLRNVWCKANGNATQPVATFNNGGGVSGDPLIVTIAGLRGLGAGTSIFNGLAFNGPAVYSILGYVQNDLNDAPVAAWPGIIAGSTGAGTKVKTTALENLGLAGFESANYKQGVTVAMVAGSVTVANTSITATSRIFPSRLTPGGTLGHISYSVNPGVGFTLTSSSNTETSTFAYEIFEVGV